MESLITYKRNGVTKTVTVPSNLLPNILAVKFALVDHELPECDQQLPHHSINALFDAMRLEIIQVVPLGSPEAPKA
jgi:hypothetical protein